MKLSCILLNYNDYNKTIESIERIETIPEIDKIVVVDNCSTENDYQKLLIKESKRTIVLETDKNGGYGYGNNKGLNISEKLGMTHSIIANPDVVFNRQCVCRIIKAFADHPECGVIAPSNYYKGKLSAHRMPSYCDVLRSSSSLLSHIFVEKTYVIPKANELYVDEVVGAMLAVDLKKMSFCMYDERFFLYYEEFVLGYKMKERGFKTLVLLDVTYFHKVSTSISKEYSSLYKTRKLANRSKLLYIRYYLHKNKLLYFFSKIFMQVTLVEAYAIDIIAHKG